MDTADHNGAVAYLKPALRTVPSPPFERSPTLSPGRRFGRSFGVPGHVKADAISATYDAGVLRIRIAAAYKGVDAQRIEVTGGESKPAIEA